MKDRVKLLPSRSTTVGGPLLLVAGLSFISVGVYYRFQESLPSASAELLISLGFLAAGLGSTILVYLRRVSIRVLCERVKEKDQLRFRIILAEPGGTLRLAGDLTQTKELRISPRSGAVFFVRLPGNIYLEVHRFSSRREASKKYLRIEALQRDCILPAHSEPPVPSLQPATFKRLKLMQNKRTVLWSDPVALETSFPLAVFFAGMVFLVLLGLEVALTDIHRAGILGLIFLGTLFGGLVSSSVRYIQMRPDSVATGRLLFRYSTGKRDEPEQFPAFLHQRKVYADAGVWQLWREEVLPTAELRLYHRSGTQKKPIRRIRLHSSLTASISLFQNLQSLHGAQPPALMSEDATGNG